MGLRLIIINMNKHPADIHRSITGHQIKETAEVINREHWVRRPSEVKVTIDYGYICEECDWKRYVTKYNYE